MNRQKWKLGRYRWKWSGCCKKGIVFHNRRQILKGSIRNRYSWGNTRWRKWS